jgi:hypothetical protein
MYLIVQRCHLFVVDSMVSIGRVWDMIGFTLEGEAGMNIMSFLGMFFESIWCASGTFFAAVLPRRLSTAIQNRQLWKHRRKCH